MAHIMPDCSWEKFSSTTCLDAADGIQIRCVRVYMYTYIYILYNILCKHKLYIWVLRVSTAMRNSLMWTGTHWPRSCHFWRPHVPFNKSGGKKDLGLSPLRKHVRIECDWAPLPMQEHQPLPENTWRHARWQRIEHTLLHALVWTTNSQCILWC